jgi:hypothetical protein
LCLRTFYPAARYAIKINAGHDATGKRTEQFPTRSDAATSPSHADVTTPLSTSLGYADTCCSYIRRTARVKMLLPVNCKVRASMIRIMSCFVPKIRSFVSQTSRLRLPICTSVGGTSRCRYISTCYPNMSFRYSTSMHENVLIALVDMCLDKCSVQ